MFARRSRPAAATAVDVHPHVYLIHYAEHDRVIACNARDIHDAIRYARDHMHVFTDHPLNVSRPMMHDDDRICVMIYGKDYEYTCNVARVNVYTTNIDLTNTLARP